MTGRMCRPGNMPGLFAIGWRRLVLTQADTAHIHCDAPSSLRRTKAALIYRKTGNLRAVQLLLGHTKVDSTVRYLGVELEDALSIAEKIDI